MLKYVIEKNNDLNTIIRQFIIYIIINCYILYITSHNLKQYKQFEILNLQTVYSSILSISIWLTRFELNSRPIGTIYNILLYIICANQRNKNLIK